MLSIGKLTPGRASYYAEQLPGGADEYYTRDEAAQPAVWLGKAADRLGVSGAVDPESFRRLLDAAHPRTGKPLGVPRTTDHRLAGFDLCFSAPKSVSVAWALAPPDIAHGISAAHDRAVSQSIEVFETEVARARRGKRAATLIPTEGVAAAAFGHRTSRAGDPQLHTHVVVPNLTVDPAGRWSALAGDRVYRWAKTLGYLYQSALRAELTKTLGVSFGPVRNGAAEISGIDQSVRDEFSTRRTQITAAMDRAGSSSRAAAEVAALATRSAKTAALDLGALRQEWQERAGALGVDAQLGLPESGGRNAPDHTRALAQQLLSPEGLTANSSSFDQRDVLRAIAEGHPEGISPDDALAAASRFLERPEVVALPTDRPAGPRYSTTELIDLETRLVGRASHRRQENTAVVPHREVRAALADRPTLTNEQKQMIRSLTTSGAGVEVVIGRAGAGKTFALDATRAAWQAAGYAVIGAALAARAAAELQAGSGIPSTTVDRLLSDLDRSSPLSGLRPGTVLVVDEAGMVGTRKLARLAGHTERAGAKLVLVGDHRQLPEIAAGGAFAALAKTVPTTELTENRRQVEPWEREALAHLRSGAVEPAIDAYVRADRISLTGSAESARERMVEDWWRSWRAGENAAMYALRRSDVEDLNRRARARLDEAGLLGTDRVTAAGREFAEGDHVMCTKNDRRLGVRNGTRSSVASVDISTDAVALANGVILPADYLEAGHLTHSYAATVHKSQGATVDRAFLLGSDTLYREAGYVGLSRARQATQLYVVAREPDPTRPPEVDPILQTIRQLSQSKAQALAVDQLDPSAMSPIAQQTNRGAEREALLADPPAWLTQALGEPPVTMPERDLWSRHAERLAAYRDIYQISDPSDALGPIPEDRTQRRAWDLAQLSIREQQRSLDLEQGLHR